MKEIMGEIAKLVKNKRVIIGITVLILAGAIASSVYFYNKWRQTQSRIDHPEQFAQTEGRALIAKVEKLIELPQGEDPTIATVSDYEKVKNQPFFARSMNGDKVLIYTQAKKAILYRPATNKIIDVAPVNMGGDASSSAQISPTPPAAFQIATPSGTPKVSGR